VPLGVVVLDLVVDQGKVVHKLDRDRAGHGRIGASEECSGV
jgi:hypothetical protein